MGGCWRQPDAIVGDEPKLIQVGEECFIHWFQQKDMGDLSVPSSLMQFAQVICTSFLN